MLCAEARALCFLKGPELRFLFFQPNFFIFDLQNISSRYAPGRQDVGHYDIGRQNISRQDL